MTKRQRRLTPRSHRGNRYSHKHLKPIWLDIKGASEKVKVNDVIIVTINGKQERRLVTRVEG